MLFRSYNPKIITNGLIGHWDSANLKSYPGSGTTWYDLSGNGYNATMSNVTYSSGYMSFNGTSSYVTAPVPAPASTPITFEFWINSDSSSPVGIFDTAPNVTNVLRNYSAGNIEWWNADPSISLGLSATTWYCLTVVFSFATNRYIDYYRNGVLVSSTSGSTTTTFAWSNPIRFGDINNGNNGRYAGKISTIKIYNLKLSADNVKQNYNALRGRFGI